jgi:hypothetical protein
VDRLLQREPGRTVTLEAGGTVVRKEFAGPTAAAEAAREHDRLERFARALGTDGRARCPRPLELGTGEPVFVRMERAPGESLTAHLGRRAWSQDEVDRLADVLAGAVRIYVDALAEAYFDFHLRNMTYEPAAGRVWFFDFGIPSNFPPDLVGRLRELPPLDVSVGNLLGSTVFEASRPRTVLQRRRHRQSFLVAEAVRTRLPVEPAAVGWVARAAWDAAAADGGPLASAWYRSAGGLVGLRMRRAAFGSR